MSSQFSNYESFRPSMSNEQVAEWFNHKMGGQTVEHTDVYNVAKDFYQLGAYSRALLCLQYYITLTGAGSVGRHLLGYCYLNLNDIERALREFKRCVKDGFHEDWQMAVELILEIDEKTTKEIVL